MVLLHRLNPGNGFYCYLWEVMAHLHTLWCLISGTRMTPACTRVHWVTWRSGARLETELLELWAGGKEAM